MPYEDKPDKAEQQDHTPRVIVELLRLLAREVVRRIAIKSALSDVAQSKSAKPVRRDISGKN